jgi:serralysin
VHFINHGYLEKRLWEDPLLYVASFDDLITAWGDLSVATIRANAKNHFASDGFDDNDRPFINFDVEAYLANYTDLRLAFNDGNGGYDDDAAILHFIRHGFEEGRTDQLLA